MKFVRIGLIGHLRGGTIKIYGGMMRGQVGMMEAGTPRRLSGVATVRSGMDMP